MRIAFTGSRHWASEYQIREYLIGLVAEHGRAQLEICHGGARDGVDVMVAEIAEELEIDCIPYPVRKDLDGNHRGAPLNRNKRMLMSFMPDKLIAFRAPGKSNGTDNTIKHAEALGIPYVIIEEEL